MVVATLTRRLTPGALALALLLGAGLATGCGGDDDGTVSWDQIDGRFRRSGLTAEQSRCVVDILFEELDQEQLRLLADVESALPRGQVSNAVSLAITDCALAGTDAGGGTSAPSTPSDGDDGDGDQGDGDGGAPGQGGAGG